MNFTSDQTIQSGFDLPVTGLDNNWFYPIHITAIVCISFSFSCVLFVLVLSFKRQNYKSFFNWTKSERFVVYLAICDGLFNLAHFTDHFHIILTRDHPRPKELCQTYGFLIALFIMAQNLMVNIVAINAFVLMQFNKNLDFGKKDHRLLLWTLGFPMAATTIAGSLGQLGPNGISCYFDAVNGLVATFVFATLFVSGVLILNIILYILTWRRIYLDTRNLRLGNVSQSANNKAARNMTLFVLAFFIQFWVQGLLGIYGIANPLNIPIFFFFLVTIFSNIGGVLNMIVYVIIRRRMLLQNDSETKHSNQTHSSVISN